MVCKKCLEELTTNNVYPSDHRYCITCGTEHTAYLSERRQTLTSLREMNLESKMLDGILNGVATAQSPQIKISP